MTDRLLSNRLFAKARAFSRNFPASLLIVILMIAAGRDARADLPSGWTDTDIGSPADAGSASFSNGVWTVSGGGSDIWNSADQFNFASETVAADGRIVARVTSVGNADPGSGWSKAGVMFRNDLTPESMNVLMAASVGQGVVFQYRQSTGGSSSFIQAVSVTTPVWVELLRSGDEFSGYYSIDGTNWVEVGLPVRMEMNGAIQAGLAVTAHNNTALNTSTFTSVQAPSSSFGVYREMWTNLDASVGNTLFALTNTSENPGWPNSPAASFTHIFTNFQTEVNLPMNYFGQRVRTFVVPPTNGLYTFWIASDDTSTLYLSPNESAAGMSPIAAETGATGFEDWTAATNQQSAAIYLQGGCRYYLEAQMQQGGGGENLSVGWQLPNGTFEEPMAAASPAGTLLIPCDGVSTPPGIYAQTTNLSVIENQSAIFSVLATNQGPLSYQWYANGAGIGGATLPVYALGSVSLAVNNGEVFSCVITNSAGSITSAPVTLTVTPDTTPPTVAGVFNLGVSNVEILFSKPVALNANQTVNYVFTNGLAVNSIILAANKISAMLSTAPLVCGSNYVIVINNIHDRASTPNYLATNTTVSFVAAQFAPQDVGGPATASSVTYTSTGATVSGAGVDIGGASDQFNYQYQLVSGNFDVSVCVAGLSLSELWAQAGLMARASLDPGSPYAAALATPGMNGEFFSARTATNGLAATAGSFPVNYPRTWLRLNRAGNVFSGFGSYDGTNWTLLGSVSLSLPAPVYLGLATASHNAGQATVAQYANYGPTAASAVVAATPNPHDAMGPTSRRTPLAFSEIMWKPAARTDGRNLEFLEIYNSNPWFQDIGNYQINCADMSYTFPAGTTIPGGGYLVVAAAPGDIIAVYGVTNVLGPYNGSLKHSETLDLWDERTNLLLTVPYTDEYPWPVATAGTGHSLVLANPTYGEGDPRAWDISDTVGGSPGQADPYTPSPLRSVVINEILPHSESPGAPQFIELYNHSTNSVSLAGCVLTDDPATNKYVIPAGTTVGPAGFVSFTQSQFGFALNGAGETLYLLKPDGSRVLDAVQFGPQANGVSYGRWPDGANDFYALTANTPGTNNSPILIGDIVINELMYDPISGNDADQYLELYNQGTNTVNLAGWQFTTGVTFTFPNVSLAPNSYLVVAENATNLWAKYANLNSGNTVGNYSGKLSHNGELVTLCQPETLYATNPILVAEDQVSYGTGGRWGEWSGGGGSSLELIDPRSNHRLAANWTDSNDTGKSVWTNVTYTGVLDNGENYDPSIDYAQIGLLDTGECLVDNVAVIYNGSNYVANPAFEGGMGLTNWWLQGCMTRSSLESTGYLSGHALHIRSSDKLWTGDNSCEMALNANPLGQGSTVTLSYAAKWLHGQPEPLLRLNGNWLEATTVLPVPNDLGSPGQPNSTYVTNAGPAIYNVTHNPPLPAAGQAAVVTASVQDPDGVQSLTLYYRLDPATSYTGVPMADNGTGGDAIAGDGVFSAMIPGQASNQVAAFYIAATDKLGATTRFPAIRPNDNEPVRECVVVFGDMDPASSFGAYHLWLTQTNVNRWANLGDLSNEGNDGTFVDGHRVIYNMQGRFTGSPAHQQYDTPVGNLCAYDLSFNDDDMLLGTTSFNKLHVPGNTPGDDASLQREQLANTLLRSLGVPWLNRRYVAVYVNGGRRGTLMEDAQVPGSDIVKEHWPNDDDGFLYKMQPWFEMAPFAVDEVFAFNSGGWCSLLPYTTTGGVKKPACYRWNYEIRRTPDSFSDFTNVFSLVDAANSSSSPNYVADFENIADMENWMRVFAANHAAGNWDSFGSATGQNLYGYIGALGTKYSLLMWDFNIVFGNAESWGPGEYLFGLNGEDPNMAEIYANPTFLRMYWRALQDLCNGPLSLANSAPLLTAKYNAFTDEGLSVENPAASIEPWVLTAQSSIAAQLAAVNAPAFAVNPVVTTSNNVAYVSGTAPVNVTTVWINGVAWPLTWTTLTNWVVALPLSAGTNRLSVTGTGETGLPLAGDTNSLSVVYNGPNASPAGQVVINEIMYAPQVNNAQFVELYNNSTNATFNLSGWQLAGLDYTFPNGAVIGPANYLVLAANHAAFAAEFGATNPVFDVFDGALQPPQTLALAQPNANGTNNLTVAEVMYDSALPWPAATAGTSLQLIDSHQDNWRAGNWTTASADATPAAANTLAAALPAFPSLWINEVEPDNVTGITNRLGQHVPWIELYNPGTNALSLSGVYLANNFTNLLQWGFPAGASINAGQFLVVFADGLTNLSSGGQWHANFSLPAGAGAVALSRLYNGQPQVLDYLNYEGIGPDDSYGSVPDGQSFLRQELFAPTPGAANNASATTRPSYFYYSTPTAVYTQNFNSLPDPGATSVNTSNTVTIAGITYSLANPYDFAYSVTASGSAGGLGLAEMAGWYGASALESRFGATDGDQTTGGQLSFGPANSTNRALGLLATSSTGATIFGARIINGTGITLNRINVQFTGEVWRQSNLAKTLQCYYYIDPTATATFAGGATAFLPALNVNVPTVAADTGGVAVDGTQALNQTNLSVVNETITNWPAGAALWLMWQMTDDTGKAQGLAIDNFSFSATVPQSVPLSMQIFNGSLFLSWPALLGVSYQLQYTTNLAQGTWTSLGNPVTGKGLVTSVSYSLAGTPQRYFRVQVEN